MNHRQEMAFNFIKGYLSSNNEAPTFAEIAEFIGVRSPASVYQILRALENLGLIIRTPNIARGIRLA